MVELLDVFVVIFSMPDFDCSEESNGVLLSSELYYQRYYLWFFIGFNLLQVVIQQ